MYDANKIPYFDEVSWKVHDDDEMFSIAKIMMPEKGRAFHYYFYSGGFIALNITKYLQSAGLDPSILSLLDFACGYGRITRYFVKDFKEVIGSDLEKEMITFLHDEVGVDAFLSNVEIRNVKFPKKKFDVVFSFSLFTHLQPEIWEDWFWGLFEKVKKGGLFFITTRSPEFATSKGDKLVDFNGIDFKERNETNGRLDSKVYGQTTVNHSFVKNIADSKDDIIEYVDYFPGGTFDLFQDVHIFRRIS